MVDFLTDDMVAPYNNKVRLVKQKYRTGDIVSVVNEAVQTDKEQAAGLAQLFSPTKEGLRELFDYVDNRFQYQEDPKGQWVQSPSYLHHESLVGDCKESDELYL